MPDADLPTLDIADVRVGHYILLDLGWMDHPFPVGQFKITTPQQLKTVRGLGLKQLRFDPRKSDPAALIPNPESTEQPPVAPVTPEGSETDIGGELRRDQAKTQRLSLAHCERRFGEAARSYRQIQEEAQDHPEAARERSLAVVAGITAQMEDNGESVIRLLSETPGDRGSLHAVNLTVLCLLLGRSMRLSPETLNDLGVAALLHDLGKAQLPEQVRYRTDAFSAAQVKIYQDHVALGVATCKRMGLSATVQLAISQHHEMADGSGFPLGLTRDKTTPASKILSLVNRYDGLCNPAQLSAALTPHEALSLMFAQMKPRFDGPTLSAFIRMMGVYPPGSVVQLSDNRYALVDAVNSARPLKPRVVVHDPAVPREDALVLDLENVPQLSIKRSVKPQQLPRATLDYLAPRQRICYFFEQSAPPEEKPPAP